MVLLAVLAAISYLLVLTFRIPLIPAVPFLSYEPKDVILTITGFLIGPSAALITAALVALLEMVTISTTGIIGCFMNFISSACFSCAAAFFYKRKRSLKSAAFGLACGSILMVALMLLWNWLITPLYMGVEREFVVGLLLPAFLPFNLLKAGFNSALTLALYKPLASALRRTGLLGQRQGPPSHVKLGVYGLSFVILLTCIIVMLVLQGKL